MLNRGLPAVALVTLALAGCSSGAETVPTGPPTDPAPKGDDVSVIMENTQFQPQRATVRVGQKVVWSNEDAFAHTVTKSAGPGKPFDSGDIAGGDTFEFTPDAVGTIDYYCRLHPNQVGTLAVVE